MVAEQWLVALQLLLVFLAVYAGFAIPVSIVSLWWMLGRVGKARARVFSTFTSLPRPTGQPCPCMYRFLLQLCIPVPVVILALCI